VRALILFGLGLVLVFASPAGAQSVSFDEAIGLSAATPAVAGEERALAERVEGDARISDVTESSRLYAMPGLRALSDEDRGFEGQVQIGHSWNLADLAGAQRRTAARERQAREARARSVALEQRLSAARAWMSMREAEAHLATAREQLALAARIVERTERARAAGVATSADVAEARAFLSQARATVLAVRGEIVDVQVSLGAALGRADVETLGTDGPLPEPPLPEPAAIEQSLADVTRMPAVEAARLAALAMHAREVELAAVRGPRLDVDLTAYRESPAGLLLFGQVGVALPLADLAARERAIAREEAALAWRREAHRVAHEVEHTREVVRSYRDELVPALETLLAAREQQLAAGATTTLLVLEATRRLVEARASLTRAETEAAWAATRAWLLLAVQQSAREEP
jgi:cobalt-zinc-cadmium efflux system outer membrane protein